MRAFARGDIHDHHVYGSRGATMVGRLFRSETAPTTALEFDLVA